MKKILTEELILEKLLEEKELKEPGNIDTPEMQEIICEFYGSEIRHDWSNCNMYFTTVSTADGYELYLAAEDESSPYYDQDVYYYESDWFEKLHDCIVNGFMIHVDEHAMEDYGFEDAIAAVYEDYWRDMYHEVEGELMEEGYEWPEDEK